MADPGGASRNDLERIARLADGLVEQLSAARQRLEQLRAELDETPVPAAPAAAPVIPEDDPKLLRDRIRLDAMNMALTGSTRDETRERLLEDFDGVAIDDIDDAVDVTFGEILNGGDNQPPKRFRRRS